MSKATLSPFEKAFGQNFTNLRVYASNSVGEGTFVKMSVNEACLNPKDYLRIQAIPIERVNDIGAIIESLKQSFEAIKNIKVKTDD